ncbi:hypothetical protein E4U32_005542 [Claviceps aff. humidiphila group G2b]|nr:hypothetical protein E4U32_005542 [Claviceps aff. humidiphila group G2b]
MLERPPSGAAGSAFLNYDSYWNHHFQKPLVRTERILLFSGDRDRVNNWSARIIDRFLKRPAYNIFLTPSLPSCASYRPIVIVHFYRDFRGPSSSWYRRRLCDSSTSYPLFLLLRRFWNLFYGCHVLRTVDEDLSFLCFRSTVRKKSCVSSSIALSLPPRQLCFITCSLSIRSESHQKLFSTFARHDGRLQCPFYHPYFRPSLALTAATSLLSLRQFSASACHGSSLQLHCLLSTHQTILTLPVTNGYFSINFGEDISSFDDCGRGRPFVKGVGTRKNPSLF